MEARASFLRRRRWVMWVGAGLLAALALLAVVADIALHRAEPFLRARIVEELQDRFHARVELDGFHVSLVHGLWAEGTGLRIWPPASHPAHVEGVAGPASGGDQPLIRLHEFRFHSPLRYQPNKPFHIFVVQLKGLEIHLPPRSHFEHAVAETAGGGQPTAGAGLLSLVMDSVECTGAELELETSNPGKLPLSFAIDHFKLTNLSAGGPMGFEAELTNPLPVGTIHSTGSFGPWLVADPGESAITGDYRFEHADLASFKGIAGILTSTGHFQGTLRNLVADGETDTPDFRLSHFGNALPLHTRFHARVDATDGDTWLEPVDATLGHSHFTAQGQIVRVIAAEAGAPPHSIGHDIALTVSVDRARVEDFLRLTSHSAVPLLTGAVAAKAALHIPPGADRVEQRLKLNGSFELDQARFTSAKIQDRIEQLSLRGQGRPHDLKTADPAAIRSRMKGDFQMAGGVIGLQNLEYTVPGAVIQLKGAYGVEGGTLDFAGTAKMEATVSQMVGGWKGLLLTPADRFFKKNGAGTEVRIYIAGTRENPEFGIEFGRNRPAAQTDEKR